MVNGQELITRMANFCSPRIVLENEKLVPIKFEYSNRDHLTLNVAKKRREQEVTQEITWEWILPEFIEPFLLHCLLANNKCDSLFSPCPSLYPDSSRVRDMGIKAIRKYQKNCIIRRKGTPRPPSWCSHFDWFTIVILKNRLPQLEILHTPRRIL